MPGAAHESAAVVVAAAVALTSQGNGAQFIDSARALFKPGRAVPA